MRFVLPLLVSVLLLLGCSSSAAPEESVTITPVNPPDVVFSMEPGATLPPKLVPAGHHLAGGNLALVLQNTTRFADYEALLTVAALGPGNENAVLAEGSYTIGNGASLTLTEIKPIPPDAVRLRVAVAVPGVGKQQNHRSAYAWLADVEKLRATPVWPPLSPAPTTTAIPATMSTPNAGERVIYWEDFSSGNQGWLTGVLVADKGITVPAAWSPFGHVFTNSPWFVTPSHANFQEGRYVGPAFREAGWEPGDPVGFLQLPLVRYVSVQDVSQMTLAWDLRNATVRFRMLAEGLNTKGAHLFFGVEDYVLDEETPGTGKRFSLAFTRKPLEQLILGSQWVDIELKLTTNPQDWTCFGVAEFRATDWGCAPVDEVLARVNDNFGFFMFPVDPDPDQAPVGLLRLDEIRITTEEAP